MVFLLTALKISFILDPSLEPIPNDPQPTEEGELPQEDQIEQLKQARKKREDDELLCRGQILNTLSDRLYDLFTGIKSASDIWNALELKYKAEEEGTNKYLIAKYFDFRMVDNKLVLEQIHELQVIVNKIHSLKIILPEPFQVGAIIAKLPPSWKDYGKKLLHKSKDFTLEQIQKHLRIEEESRLRDHFPVQSESKVLNLEASGSHSKNKALQLKNDGQKFKKQNNYKKYPKKKGACHVCGKFGHYAKECRF
ncbi:uncharacterized protein LOC143845466 [Tasmannia lanceolata]|uniref:uncharacterized protein LOC143845466 n=1 Tax=Tasmannia lanceolata TaxID=3420 RepID=UPI004063AF28